MSESVREQAAVAAALRDAGNHLRDSNGRWCSCGWHTDAPYLIDLGNEWRKHIASLIQPGQQSALDRYVADKVAEAITKRDREWDLACTTTARDDEIAAAVAAAKREYRDRIIAEFSLAGEELEKLMALPLDAPAEAQKQAVNLRKLNDRLYCRSVNQR